MKNITTILPVHKLTDNYKTMCKNMVESIEQFYEDVKLIIVCPSELKNEFNEMSQKLEIKVIENKGDTGFCNQVNLGFSEVDTEWFTIAEIDDEFTKIWLPSMRQYILEHNEVDVFLPIVKDVNGDGKFLSFTNETVWAYGFCDTQGFLDNEVLLDFQNYQTSGALYRTKVIKENGLFKDNLKLTFSYEFLLRLTHNGVKVMTVPRIGYIHSNFREDSLFWSYKNDEQNKLSENEIKFWVDSAKKEFFFKNKRDLKYVEQIN